MEASLRSEVSTKLTIIRTDHEAKRSTSPTRRPLFIVRYAPLTIFRMDHEAEEVNFTPTEASLRSEVST